MLKIFIHTWKINRWEEVLEEQLKYIEDSGLGKEAVTEVCYNDDEGKTLLDIWNFCNNEDSYVLYLQNLGITYQGITKLENMTAKYRRWVMDGVVGNWKEYVSYLKEFDVVADNFKEEKKDYKKHFSANMWWSKSEYIKTLKNQQTKDFYSQCGFNVMFESDDTTQYQLEVNNYKNNKIQYIGVSNGS